jgi:hypothetical protein
VAIWVSVAGIPGLKIETWGTLRFLPTHRDQSERTALSLDRSFNTDSVGKRTKEPGFSPGGFVNTDGVSKQNEPGFSVDRLFNTDSVSKRTKEPGFSPGGFVNTDGVSKQNEPGFSVDRLFNTDSVEKNRWVPQVSILRPGIPATETQMVTRL